MKSLPNEWWLLFLLLAQVLTLFLRPSVSYLDLYAQNLFLGDESDYEGEEGASWVAKAR